MKLKIQIQIPGKPLAIITPKDKIKTADSCMPLEESIEIL